MDNTSNSEINNHNFRTSLKNGNLNKIFGKNVLNIDGNQEIIINDNGIVLVNNDNIQEKELNRNQDHLNEIIDAQVENSETVYNSVHIQFILFFIATLILVGFVFIINVSGNLSIFVVIILAIVLFLIFKFLRFNIVNFISNFTL